MEPVSKKPWYKNKLYLVLGGLLGMGFVSAATSNTSTSQLSYPSTTQSAAVVQSLSVGHPATQISPNRLQPQTKKEPLETNTLSNDNHYVNTKGNEVHSPAYSESVPSGASAQCRDGTYSFSQSRRGTCSHHGGVKTWY